MARAWKNIQEKLRASRRRMTEDNINIDLKVIRQDVDVCFG